MTLREGEYIETYEGLLFHVKGNLHPPDRTIAFLRYVPDKNGERKKGGTRYRKIYPLKERFEYLESNYPKYVFNSDRFGRKIQAVPAENVEKVYKPEEKLEELREETSLDAPELDALNLSKRITEKPGIKSEKLGVTGSILVGLHGRDSDVDLIAYGENQGRKVYSALGDMKSSQEGLEPYGSEGALKIAKFRWGETGLPIEKMARIEQGKNLHGLFNRRDFFMRLVKERKDIPSEYEDLAYFPSGRGEVVGIIRDDEDSIFTPNMYEIKDPSVLKGPVHNITKISSFRGRFAEQVKKRDKIRACGTVERVRENGKEYHQLVLGHPEDYLVPNDLIQDYQKEK